jgi:hypothetical protein
MGWRLSLGVLALTALGLATVGTVAAQDGDMGASGSGMSGMSQQGTGMGPMGMPGMGMGPMGMGPMGMPGMGPMGMGMPGMGMGMSGASSGPGAGMAPAFPTAIHHPGDLSGIVPCTGCGAIADPCSFGGNCQYMEAGLWPENLGLHPTTNRPSLSLYFPQGPMSCARGRGNNPAACVDAPGEWNLRAGMPSDSGSMGGAGR